MVNQQTLSPDVVAHRLTLGYFPLADLILFAQYSVFIDMHTLFTEWDTNGCFVV